MLKVGLIGCGGIGNTHQLSVKALTTHYDIGITAMADVRPAFMQRFLPSWPGARLYESGMALIENADVDLALICLPTYLHAEHAINALRKGIPVFIEKPVCLKDAECAELLKVQRETGIKAGVGQVLRLWEEYAYLKRTVDSGVYGKLKSIVMHRISGSSPGAPAGFENWFADIKRSGSMVLDLHIHDVDFLRYLLGEPDEFYVNSRKNSQGLPEHLVTEYRFGDIIASVEAGSGYAQGFPFEAAYRASFENATVVYCSTASPTLVEYGNGKMRVPQLPKSYMEACNPEHKDVQWISPYCLELRYFIECIQHGHDNTVLSLREGAASVRQCLKELDAALGKD